MELDSASYSNPQGVIAVLVEQCTCPQGYVGHSCEVHGFLPTLLYTSGRLSLFINEFNRILFLLFTAFAFKGGIGIWEYIHSSTQTSPF